MSERIILEPIPTAAEQQKLHFGSCPNGPPLLHAFLHPPLNEPLYVRLIFGARIAMVGWVWLPLFAEAKLRIQRVTAADG